MNMDEKIVEPLKKVTLSVTPGNAPDGSGPAGPTQKVEFIFGVGPRGLAPFEYELAGMKPGDKLTIPVVREKAGEVFCYLQPLFCGMTAHHECLYLNIGITDVTDAQHREVIRALAGAAACGSDCGCGCGGH